MLRQLLSEQNQNLRREISALLQLATQSDLPTAHQPFADEVALTLEACRRRVQQNLSHLAINNHAILENVLSLTQQISYRVRLISEHLVIPLARPSNMDRLCLQIIQWMHRSHSLTMQCPAAFANGQVAILPLKDTPLYYFPYIDQNHLLYLPLLFHEFGHELYALHKPELDDLVLDLRRDIAEILIPASQRNDKHSEQQATKRRRIVNVWYDWMQEFFCDAVGLVMGGPSFLQAFSAFMCPLQQVDFYRNPDYLIEDHPVTLLRIRFLCARARKLGYNDVAQSVENAWTHVAEVCDIQEDYHGFYDSLLERVVYECLENMLTETDPRPCLPEEPNGDKWDHTHDSPIRLLNWAWQVFESNPDQYWRWEQENIDLFLSVEFDQLAW
jgi:hypothetical protein